MLWVVFLVLSAATAYLVNDGMVCTVYPEGKMIDDSASILEAFELCGQSGTVILGNGTFYVDQVMNTTNLANCDVELHGTMLWSTNTIYWLKHSYPVVYQNLSTAWLFGGVNVTFQGFGTGTLDGNGQTWYTENRNSSNQPGRPIAITFYNSTNLYVDGLAFHQPQFWSTFVSHVKNGTFTNINVNATSDDGNTTVNTDGSDTWNSDSITYENWGVHNQDDCIGIKGNSTNIYMNNITCNSGYGIPIGSIAQFATMPDYVENVTVENVHLIGTEEGAYIKGWPGVQLYDNMGNLEGGGGKGFCRNVTFRNFKLEDVQIPVYVTQCTSGSENTTVCDTSQWQISNVTWQNFTGTSRWNVATSIHCSAAAPCSGMRVIDMNFTQAGNDSSTLKTMVYQCANLVGQNFTNSSVPCNQYAPGCECLLFLADNRRIPNTIARLLIR